MRQSQVAIFTVYLVLIGLLASFTSAEEFYNKASGVVSLTSANFDKLVKSKTNKAPWIVEFYAPWCGHCQKLKPEYVKLGKKLKNVANVGAVDCDKDMNKALAGKYGIKGFPTIKVFTSDGKVTDYQGARTASAMSNYVMSLIPSNVVSVTSKSSKSFLGSNPETPKVLLFSSKQTTSPVYKSLSTSFEGVYEFGEVRRKQKKLIKKFEVEDFPSLLIVFPSTDGDEDRILRFVGDMKNSGAIKAFLKANDPSRTPLTPFINPDDDAIVSALSDESCLQAVCGARSALCVTLVTNSNIEQSAKYLYTLDSAARDSSIDTPAFRYGWVNGTVEQDFMEALELTSDYPKLVVFSISKKRSATFVGSFTEENVVYFLRSVLSGRQKTIPLSSDEFPKLNTDSENCKTEPKPQKKPKRNTPKTEEELKDRNVVLTKENFDELVLDSNSMWMVEFFAPWCGHCQKLKPEWERAANEMKGTVKFGTVDCTVETELAEAYGIEGFPTVKGFFVDKSDPIPYQGERTTRALKKFASQSIPSDKVATMGLEGLQSWVAQNEGNGKPKVILLTKRSRVSSLFKSLSYEVEELDFAAVLNAREKQIHQALGNSNIQLPAIVIFGTDRQVAMYDGPKDFDSMLEFFNLFSSEQIRFTTDDEELEEYERAAKAAAGEGELNADEDEDYDYEKDEL